MRDPQVRDYSVSAPSIPDWSGRRYQWLPGDPTQERVRLYLQEGGRGLYVLFRPDIGMKMLVEAYYPEDIRPAYYRENLTGPQKVDYECGLLVVVGELKAFHGELSELDLLPFKRNNRNARADLKRTRPDSYHLLDLKAAAEAEEGLDKLDELADEAGTELGEAIWHTAHQRISVPKDIT